MTVQEPKILGVEVSKMREELERQSAKGKRLEYKPVMNNGEIIAYDFPAEDGSVIRCGPQLFPWVPHHPETWPYRYMTTKVPITLSVWNGHDKPNTTRELPIGTRVKIVMASRFGDVGITDELNVEHGYHLRVDISQLESKFDNFSMEP